jgi:hypothetical protein
MDRWNADNAAQDAAAQANPGPPAQRRKRIVLSPSPSPDSSIIQSIMDRWNADNAAQDAAAQANPGPPAQRRKRIVLSPSPSPDSSIIQSIMDRWNADNAAQDAATQDNAQNHARDTAAQVEQRLAAQRNSQSSHGATTRMHCPTGSIKATFPFNEVQNQTRQQFVRTFLHQQTYRGTMAVFETGTGKTATALHLIRGFVRASAEKSHVIWVAKNKRALDDLDADNPWAKTNWVPAMPPTWTETTYHTLFQALSSGNFAETTKKIQKKLANHKRERTIMVIDEAHNIYSPLGVVEYINVKGGFKDTTSVSQSNRDALETLIRDIYHRGGFCVYLTATPDHGGVETYKRLLELCLKEAPPPSPNYEEIIQHCVTFYNPLRNPDLLAQPVLTQLVWVHHSRLHHRVVDHILGILMSFPSRKLIESNEKNAHHFITAQVLGLALNFTYDWEQFAHDRKIRDVATLWKQWTRYNQKRSMTWDKTRHVSPKVRVLADAIRSQDEKDRGQYQRTFKHVILTGMKHLSLGDQHGQNPKVGQTKNGKNGIPIYASYKLEWLVARLTTAFGSAAYRIYDVNGVSDFNERREGHCIIIIGGDKVEGITLQDVGTAHLLDLSMDDESNRQRIARCLRMCKSTRLPFLENTAALVRVILYADCAHGSGGDFESVHRDAHRHDQPHRCSWNMKALAPHFPQDAVAAQERQQFLEWTHKADAEAHSHHNRDFDEMMSHQGRSRDQQITVRGRWHIQQDRPKPGQQNDNHTTSHYATETFYVNPDTTHALEVAYRKVGWRELFQQSQSQHSRAQHHPSHRGERKQREEKLDSERLNTAERREKERQQEQRARHPGAPPHPESQQHTADPTLAFYMPVTSNRTGIKSDWSAPLDQHMMCAMVVMLRMLLDQTAGAIPVDIILPIPELYYRTPPPYNSYVLTLPQAGWSQAGSHAKPHPWPDPIRKALLRFLANEGQRTLLLQFQSADTSMGFCFLHRVDPSHFTLYGPAAHGAAMKGAVQAFMDQAVAQPWYRVDRRDTTRTITVRYVNTVDPPYIPGAEHDTWFHSGTAFRMALHMFKMHSALYRAAREPTAIEQWSQCTNPRYVSQLTPTFLVFLMAQYARTTLEVKSWLNRWHGFSFHKHYWTMAVEYSHEVWRTLQETSGREVSYNEEYPLPLDSQHPYQPMAQVGVGL